MPRFVEVMEDETVLNATYTFIDADKIVSLRLFVDPTPPYWLATTSDHRTFRISEHVGRIIMKGAIHDLEEPEAA